MSTHLRVEVVVGWRVVQAPLTPESKPFDRVKLALFDTTDPKKLDCDVEDMDGVKLVYETSEVGR